MASITPIAPVIRRIEVPAELRALQGWLMWRYEAFDEEAKPRKVPYWADGTKRYGKQGGSVDRGKLTTFAAARDAAARRGFDGVGFAPMPDFGYTFLDFDNCVDADGVLQPEVGDLICNTYAEYSPSGRGVRAVLRGDLGNNKSHGGDETYGVETFSSSGYVTFTGNILPATELLGLENTVATVTEPVEALCRARFGGSLNRVRDFDPDDFMAGHEPKLGLEPERMAELLSRLDADMSREDWIRVGMALHHETDGGEDGFELWDAWSSDGVSYPGEEGLRTQWDSFDRRKGRKGKQVTMASVIKMANEISPDRQLVTPEALEQVEAVEAADYTGRFRAVQVGQLDLLPQSQWIIKGILPASRDPTILFGASGSGKSFIALDMAMSIARGVDWFGHRTKQMRVAYVAAEGGAGVGKRIKAYCDQHMVDPASLDLYTITAAPNILVEDDISDLVQSLRTFGPFGLVIIDTLAQVTPGANENAGEDMSLALGNVKTIIEATGASTEIVHHSGKDLNRGSRGWSGLKAGAEAQLEVVRDPDTGARHLYVEKMKDGEDGSRFGFTLTQMALGLDADGDPITSCVVEQAELPAPADDRKGVKRRGTIETHILEVMETFGAQDIVSTEDLIRRATDMLPEPEQGKRDTRRQSIVRSLTALSKEKDGPLQVDGGRVIFYQ